MLSMIVISGIIEEDAEIIPAVDVGQGGGSPIGSAAGGSTHPAVVVQSTPTAVAGGSTLLSAVIDHVTPFPSLVPTPEAVIISSNAGM